MNREELVRRWAQSLHVTIQRGGFGSDIRLTGIRTISGPRCGAVEMLAGASSDRLYQSLAKASRAVLRQTVPWSFTGHPTVFFSGRFIRVEAGWPENLSEKHVLLADLPGHPKEPNRWVVGKSELGATVVMSLNDRTPHVLVAGTTGSGKSTALCSAILQLSRYQENEIVLLDGKFGDTLRMVEHLSAYPLARNHEDVRKALAWSLNRVQDRIVHSDHTTRTILFFDEFQVFTSDQTIKSLLTRLAQQGRSGGVHLLLATQHPTVDAFGDPSTSRCLPASLAFAVRDHAASRIAVGGSTPRADRLLGEGDGYTVTPSAVHRIQGAWVRPNDIPERTREMLFQSWPEPEWESLGYRSAKSDRAPQYTAREIITGMRSAIYGEGRDRFLARFVGNKPGSNRADRVLRLTRKVWKEIRDEATTHAD
jgi:hypothetical protein